MVDRRKSGGGAAELELVTVILELRIDRTAPHWREQFTPQFRNDFAPVVSD